MTSQLPVTILYVDDEEMACKYFARMASSEFTVLTAPGVDAALKILETERIGVLVTDYQMQEKDGGDLLREVAKEYPHTVCILVTAYADKNLLLDTVNSADIFRILEKPLDTAQVRDVLRLATNLARDRATHRQRLTAINETLAFLSHELNTPLATIVNFTHGIKQHITAADGSPQSLQEIERATTSIHDSARYCLKVLSTLAASVQNVENLSAGNNESSAQQLVNSLIDTFPLTPAQRALIRIEVSEDFGIKALPNIVSLVLSSILSNALRALQGHPEPAICITILVDGTPQIWISDNGPGINPEIITRLLVNPITTHANNGGSGWGLILSNRIMQAFGGGIAVYSQPNKGTTVTLKFPATQIS